MTYVLLFAYRADKHGMFRERVPVDCIEARETELRADGWEVGHAPDTAEQKEESP
jgi:hypothetical protein